MQLIARRAIGVSENRRRLYGVGFGIASLNGPYELKIDGSAEVRRLFVNCSSVGTLADTPAIRRHAPRKLSLIFMMFSLCGAGALARELRRRQNLMGPTQRGFR
jgi:hypothetical protein